MCDERVIKEKLELLKLNVYDELNKLKNEILQSTLQAEKLPQLDSMRKTVQKNRYTVQHYRATKHQRSLKRYQGVRVCRRYKY